MPSRFAVSLVILLSLLFCVAVPVYAAPDNALTARSPDGKIVVRLYTSKCEDEVLKFIPPHLREHFLAGDAVFDGVEHKACWAEPGDGSVILVYEDGESGRVPAYIFTPEKGT